MPANGPFLPEACHALSAREVGRSSMFNHVDSPSSPEFFCWCSRDSDLDPRVRVGKRKRINPIAIGILGTLNRV